MEIIHLLDDIHQPYSCTEWGNSGSIGIPPIVDDGTINTIFKWFNNPGGENIYPLIIFIDHTLKIVYIENSLPSYDDSNFIIEAMLENMPEMSISFNTDIPVSSYYISQIYPNPFNPVLNINFDIPWSGFTQVDIIDIVGIHIKTLQEGFLTSGNHELSWNAEGMPSGVYLVSLKHGDQSLVEKVVLLK